MEWFHWDDSMECALTPFTVAFCWSGRSLLGPWTSTGNPISNHWNCIDWYLVLYIIVNLSPLMGFPFNMAMFFRLNVMFQNNIWKTSLKTSFRLLGVIRLSKVGNLPQMAFHDGRLFAKKEFHMMSYSRWYHMVHIHIWSISTTQWIISQLSC